MGSNLLPAGGLTGNPATSVFGGGFSGDPATNFLSGMTNSVADGVTQAFIKSGLSYGTTAGSQQTAMLAAQELGMGTASSGLSTSAAGSMLGSACIARLNSRARIETRPSDKRRGLRRPCIARLNSRARIETPKPLLASLPARQHRPAKQPGAD